MKSTVLVLVLALSALAKEEEKEQIKRGVFGEKNYKGYDSEQYLPSQNEINSENQHQKLDQDSLPEKQVLREIDLGSTLVSNNNGNGYILVENQETRPEGEEKKEGLNAVTYKYDGRNEQNSYYEAKNDTVLDSEQSEQRQVIYFNQPEHHIEQTQAYGLESTSVHSQGAQQKTENLYPESNNEQVSNLNQQHETLGYTYENPISQQKLELVEPLKVESTGQVDVNSGIPNYSHNIRYTYENPQINQNIQPEINYYPVETRPIYHQDIGHDKPSTSLIFESVLPHSQPISSSYTHSSQSPKITEYSNVVVHKNNDHAVSYSSVSFHHDQKPNQKITYSKSDLKTSLSPGYSSGISNNYILQDYVPQKTNYASYQNLVTPQVKYWDTNKGEISNVFAVEQPKELQSIQFLDHNNQLTGLVEQTGDQLTDFTYAQPHYITQEELAGLQQTAQDSNLGDHNIGYTLQQTQPNIQLVANDVSYLEGNAEGYGSGYKLEQYQDTNQKPVHSFQGESVQQYVGLDGHTHANTGEQVGLY